MGTVNADAPATVWSDPSTLADAANAYGYGWVYPLQTVNAPHVITLANLCAGPPPPVPDFSVEDVGAGYLMLAGLPTSALFGSITSKINTLADRHLYDLYCTMDDGSAPPPPPPPPPPPAGMPEGPPSGGPSLQPQQDRRTLDEIHEWLDWFRRQGVTTFSVPDVPVDVSGSGVIQFAPIYGPAYPSYGVGLNAVGVELLAAPNYEGHSAGVPTLHYDLGSVAWGALGHYAAPQKLMWDHQLLPAIPEGDTVAYNLAPGVTVRITPFYRDQVSTEAPPS